MLDNREYKAAIDEVLDVVEGKKRKFTSAKRLSEEAVSIFTKIVGNYDAGVDSIYALIQEQLDNIGPGSWTSILYNIRSIGDEKSPGVGTRLYYTLKYMDRRNCSAAAYSDHLNNHGPKALHIEPGIPAAKVKVKSKNVVPPATPDYIKQALLPIKNTDLPGKAKKSVDVDQVQRKSSGTDWFEKDYHKKVFFHELTEEELQNKNLRMLATTPTVYTQSKVREAYAKHTTTDKGLLTWFAVKAPGGKGYVFALYAY